MVKHIVAVTHRLNQIGAAWACAEGKVAMETETTRFYHIYPDKNYPYQILRFSNLQRLMQWIRLHERGMNGLVRDEDYQLLEDILKDNL